MAGAGCGGGTMIEGKTLFGYLHGDSVHRGAG